MNNQKEIWTVSSIMAWYTSNLSSDEAISRADYERLLCYALGLSRVDLYTNYHMPVATMERDSFKSLLREFRSGMPVPYLIGKADFYGREFKVTPDVLIPRVETECLVERVVSQIGSRPSRVLEVVVGSGCIAVTIAAEASNSEIVGLDISEAALAIAEENSANHGVDPNLKVRNVLSSGFEGLGHFDIIVSNPPYIATDSIHELDVSVRGFEPWLALDGGEQGLEFYEFFAKNAFHALKQNGFLLVEIGYNQGNSVCSLLESHGWRDVVLSKDFAGLDRVVSARSPARV